MKFQKWGLQSKLLIKKDGVITIPIGEKGLSNEYIKSITIASLT